MAIPRLFVAADMCVSFLAGRSLAMDVRTDSAIQAFRRNATLHIDAIDSPAMLVATYPTTRCHKSENSSLYFPGRDSDRSHINSAIVSCLNMLYFELLILNNCVRMRSELALKYPCVFLYLRKLCLFLCVLSPKPLHINANTCKPYKSYRFSVFLPFK
jgi:hypothetical protein